MVRDSLSTLLQHWGHRVIQGADAQEVLAAWEKASRPRLDAAVVDLRLREGHTGLEAIALLRNRLGSQLPALVITVISRRSGSDNSTKQRNPGCPSR